MKDDWESLNEIEQRICDSPNPYAGVAELAAKIICLINDGREKDELTNYFHRIVGSHALEATPERHVNYARRLISANVTIFEEVFKVLTLLEELEAMKMLGLTPSKAEEAQLQNEFEQWSTRSPDNLRKAAELFRDSWLQNSWFLQAIRK